MEINIEAPPPGRLPFVKGVMEICMRRPAGASVRGAYCIARHLRRRAYTGQLESGWILDPFEIAPALPIRYRLIVGVLLDIKKVGIVIDNILAKGFGGKVAVFKGLCCFKE